MKRTPWLIVGTIGGLVVGLFANTVPERPGHSESSLLFFLAYGLAVGLILDIGASILHRLNR